MTTDQNIANNRKCTKRVPVVAFPKAAAKGNAACNGFLADFGSSLGWTLLRHRSSHAVNGVGPWRDEAVADGNHQCLMKVHNMNIPQNNQSEQTNGTPGSSNGTSGPAVTPPTQQGVSLAAPVETSVLNNPGVRLFEPKSKQSEALNGQFTATVVDVVKLQMPASEGKKRGRKAKAGQRKKTEANASKEKSVKAGALLLRVVFEVSQGRDVGTSVRVTKDVRANQKEKGRFADFIRVLLPTEHEFKKFFSEFELGQLLNRRCRLKLKQSLRAKDNTVKIVGQEAEETPTPAPVTSLLQPPMGAEVPPASAPATQFTYSGTIGSTVTGQLVEKANVEAIAA